VQCVVRVRVAEKEEGNSINKK